VVAAGGLLALAWCDAVSVVVGTTVAPIPFSAKRMFERHAHFSRFCRCPVVDIAQTFVRTVV
jgi:hypothetical protein